MTRGKKERLGRGLGALLGEYLGEDVPEGEAGEVRMLPLERIRPNPFQPRKEFQPEELEELANSIRENGLLQPLMVRPAPGGGDRWEVVAGERRLRAVSLLGWTEVQSLVREVDDQTLLVLALVENLQREALGPLEEAEGYQVLTESFGLTQGEIAQAVGKDRSTVANTLRLLQLPPSVRKLVAQGDLSAGHARPLLGLGDAVRASDLARRAVQEGWSVRRVEEAVRKGREGSSPTRGKASGPRDPVLKVLEEELRGSLGTRVVLRRGRKGKGVVEIPFLSADDFERIFLLLTGKEASEVVE
ncbi:MAG: ParB/RepB/Spo0J family partition protein [Gemmatimonadota bacterium]